jgi:hypothetical protein
VYSFSTFANAGASSALVSSECVGVSEREDAELSEAEADLVICAALGALDFPENATIGTGAVNCAAEEGGTFTQKRKARSAPTGGIDISIG